MPDDVQPLTSTDPVTVAPAAATQEPTPLYASEPIAVSEAETPAALSTEGPTTETAPTVPADLVVGAVPRTAEPAPSVPAETVEAVTEPVAEPHPAGFISAMPPITPPGGPSAAPTALDADAISRLLVKANAALHSRKRAKLEKIVQLAGTKESISNDDVEKLLRVSHATATRYLSALAKAGTLEPFGPPHRTRFRLKR